MKIFCMACKPAILLLHPQALQSPIYIAFFCAIIPVKRITAQKTKEGILFEESRFHQSRRKAGWHVAERG